MNAKPISMLLTAAMVMTALPTQAQDFDVNAMCIPWMWMGDRNHITFDPHWTAQTRDGSPVIRIKYDYGDDGWTGIYWTNRDNNAGDMPGVDLSQHNCVSFWAKGDRGGEVVELIAGGVGDEAMRATTGKFRLSSDWTEYSIPIDDQERGSIVGCIGVFMVADALQSATILIDDIKYHRAAGSCR